MGNIGRGHLRTAAAEATAAVAPWSVGRSRRADLGRHPRPGGAELFRPGIFRGCLPIGCQPASVADQDPIYLGEDASALDLDRLAEVYRAAAYRALGSIRRGDPLTGARFRLLALRSVEPTISAYLSLGGTDPAVIRRMSHALGARLALATKASLVLRRRTAAHIGAVFRDREYLVARYCPERLGTASQVNRLLATVDEMGVKVFRALVGEARPTPPPLPIVRRDRAGCR